jgi:hypothetical protein
MKARREKNNVPAGSENFGLATFLWLKIPSDLKVTCQKSYRHW